MFWGVVLEPSKRYSQTVESSFHLTNAALDLTNAGPHDDSQVWLQCDGTPYLLCTLQKAKVVQAPLQLFFKKGSDITFFTSGKATVHLTGFMEPDDFDLDDEDDIEEEEDEEVPELVKPAKRKAVESPPASATSKKSKKQQPPPEEDDSDVEDDQDIARLLQDDESDENDESYVPNDTAEVSVADTDEDDDDDDDEEDTEDDEDSEPKQTEKPKQNGVDKKAKANKENEPKKEKTVLPGNVAVEDLRVGQGAVAKPGKMVQVYYEGRLKSNNKMFDSTNKGPGFKFKLGKKEVIAGWDVGLVGMRVGGKRRIVCPPGMAYGKKGSPPVIPPNSTLVFEVELKNVN